MLNLENTPSRLSRYGKKRPEFTYEMMMTPREQQLYFDLISKRKNISSGWIIVTPRHQDEHTLGLVRKGMIRVEGENWLVWKGAVTTTRRWLAAHLTATVH